MSRKKSAMRVGRANKTGFRNGLRGVKSLVSTSPTFGLRRRSLASVRGRREAATLCHQRKQRAYLTTRSPSRDGHGPISGFTDSIVPATGLRTKRALSGPLRNPCFRSGLGVDVLRRLSFFRPAEARSVDPHPMKDHADLARQGDLGPFRPTPFRDVHSPALQRRETRDARQIGHWPLRRARCAPSRRRRA